MNRSWDRQPHTLAQFARRAKISESRARAMHAEPRSPLPRADGADADGRPWWWASTIDAWCARTGREVPQDSLWVFRIGAATEPAVELQRGLEELGERRHPMYVIVWDTPQGHVIYLQSLADSGDHRDWLAHLAGELVEPRWWSTAVVAMPASEMLNTPLSTSADGHREPLIHLYRLTPDQPGPAPQPVAGQLGDRIRRFLSRIGGDLVDPIDPAAAPAARTVRARADWVTDMKAAEFAEVLGAPIPIWLDTTNTPSNARRTLSYDRTFVTADTVTEWPAAQARLEAAVAAGMPADFPAAFAAVAFDATTILEEVRAGHARLADTGPGWYLVCRPAPPAPPVALERHLQGVDLVTDTELVARELTELREVEGELDVADPRGRPYAEAADLLYWQLRGAAVTDGRLRSLGEGFLPVADDDLVLYSAPWTGPVVEAWRDNLTELTGADRDQALRRRRVRRLLAHDRLDDFDKPGITDDVRHVYRDEHGRYVLVVDQNGTLMSMAEWPKSLTGLEHWTDATVLAADNPGGVVTLLALTPTDDGRMRTDPVPLQPRVFRDAFGYGYGGGTPGTTYTAILRCALGDGPDIETVNRPAASDSQLWEAISTTQGPLRLPWPQVQLWARADRRAAQTNEG